MRNCLHRCQERFIRALRIVCTQECLAFLGGKEIIFRLRKKFKALLYKIS